MMAAMSGGHDHERSKRIKRHALLRDVVLERPLWAGDDADWALIMQNRYSVICDREGCRGPLVPVDCDEVKRRRHMAYPKGSGGGCGHHDGKPEEPVETDRRISERHRWMQNRITALCRRMGYAAVPEHELTGPDGEGVARADVWVEPARMAVEVQQRRTDFKGRTNARSEGGAAQTIWLLSHDANDPTSRKALFSLPAARFKVVDRRLTRKEQWAVEFEPWLDSEALDEFATVDVWATTWQLISELPYLRTCKLDLQVFMQQVLEGRRVWVSRDPAMPRSPSGRPKTGWVLLDDLHEIRARIARDEAAAAAAAAVTVEPELPEPDESGAAECGDAEAPSPPPAPRPQPPVVPTRGSVPRATARQPVRRATPPPKPRTDGEAVADRVAIAAATIFVVVMLWAAYIKVSGWIDDLDAWWSGHTPRSVPAVEHCGDAFCRSETAWGRGRG